MRVNMKNPGRLLRRQESHFLDIVKNQKWFNFFPKEMVYEPDKDIPAFLGRLVRKANTVDSCRIYFLSQQERSNGSQGNVKGTGVVLVARIASQATIACDEMVDDLFADRLFAGHAPV